MASMKLECLIVALGASLAACATVPVVTTHCIPLRPYTASEQAALKADFDRLPEGPAKEAIRELYRMRQADRACMGK